MPVPPSPRPQLKQSRSSGWAWPHLVDRKEQKGNISQQSNTNAGPRRHLSAAASLRNLQTSRNLSTLREEQSAPTSPTHSPGSPRESMTGHRAEGSETTDVVNDQLEPVNGEPADMPLPGESSHSSEVKNGKHSEQAVNNQSSEEAGEDAEHPDDTLPGTFPVTPAAVALPGDRFPGLAQAGLVPIAEDSDTTSDLGQQYPGLAEAGLLPAPDQSSGAAEPASKGPCGCEGSFQCAPPCNCKIPPCDCTKPNTSLPSSNGPESNNPAEEHATDLTTSSSPSIKKNRVSIFEPAKPLPPPKIMIQRPSNSDISEVGEDEFPVQPSPSPKPPRIDDVLAKEMRGSEDLPLQERLDEERRITSQLTDADRERIIQDIAAGIAAVPIPNQTLGQLAKLPETGDLTKSLKIKRRMKVRRAFVRRPVLKLLLGRQLAGPAKEALKMCCLGKGVPPANVPALPNVAVDGGLPSV